jgi:hypothetical protein
MIFKLVNMEIFDEISHGYHEEIMDDNGISSQT